MTPLAGLTPAVSAKSGTDTVNSTAVATKTAGEYTATLVLPRPGKWTITIGPAGGTSTLPAVTAIAPGKPAPPPLSPASLGERLFVAKGCIGCHVNRDVHSENLVEAGPDLTGRRFSGTYLRNLLANPQAVFSRASASEPRDSEVVRWEMPNLELKESEIAALVAFINRR